MNLATETVLTGADALAAQPPLSPGELAPHFPQLEILGCLGRGGMGVVYKARQKSLNRIVALKLLAPERVQDAKFEERFTREAQALAALNHPNIVTIHDFGQAGGFYFLIMEYVDGMNLRQLLRTRKLAPAEALAVVPRICEALQYAHEHGIVHRDIKPENLLLDKEGRVKIADFGIAKMLGAESSSTGVNETQSAGTPQYMAPEQKSAPHTADNRADIYSLGVVFYEMLTGELPQGKLQPPSRKVQIDVRLDEIVLRALEEKPELRFQTVAQMSSELATVATQAQPQATERGAQPSPARPKWPRWAAVALAAPFVILAALMVGYLMLNRGWNSSRHEAFLVIATWLGVLALVLPFLTWKLLRAGRQSDDSPSSKSLAGRSALVRIVLLTLAATLLVAVVGRIVVRSYRANSKTLEATTIDRRTGLEIVRQGDRIAVSPSKPIVNETNDLSFVSGPRTKAQAQSDEAKARAQSANLPKQDKVKLKPDLDQAKLREDSSQERTAIARLKLVQAETELERLMKLYAENLVNQGDVNQAKLTVELAKAELKGDAKEVISVRLRQAEEVLERTTKLYTENLVSQYEVNKARLGVELVKAEFEGDAVAMNRVRIRQAEEDSRHASELRKQNLISESEFNKLKLENEILKAELTKALQGKTAP
jgi:tRNA A-37 threonylcarbamoyl transferase component Bud32